MKWINDETNRDGFISLLDRKGKEVERWEFEKLSIETVDFGILDYEGLSRPIESDSSTCYNKEIETTTSLTIVVECSYKGLVLK